VRWLAETRTPDATIKSITGHLSHAMLERYSHVLDEMQSRYSTFGLHPASNKTNHLILSGACFFGWADLVAFLEVLMSVRKVCCATALTTIAGARR
jgi:hypothetical protein